jgi:4a-hydroxytetrahydrobiopterin dehydratase
MSGSSLHQGFHETGWRLLAYAAGTHVRIGTFREGVALAEAIGELSVASGRYPDVDLRSDGVTVRLTRTVSGDSGEFEEFDGDDVELAAQISAAARKLGMAVDLSGLQSFQIAIDAMNIPDVVPFWAAVLGYDRVSDVVADPLREGPTVWFQQMDAPRPQRNRIHLDLYLPQDQAQARIDAALAAGGRIVNDARAPSWWTLADPEGNEVDVAPWPDLDE